MYLYPNEEELYLKNVNFGKVFESDFTYEYEGQEKIVKIFICHKPCNRDFRPLACRIFPFTPYIYDEENEEKIEIILDSRADRMCPLSINAEKIKFDDKFLDKLAECFSLCLENEEFYAFVKAQSELINDFE